MQKEITIKIRMGLWVRETIGKTDWKTLIASTRMLNMVENIHSNLE